MIQSDTDTGPAGGRPPPVGRLAAAGVDGVDWRAVADPALHFKYNMVAMMICNSLDLVFDGQNSIAGRGAQATPHRYLGTATAEPTDPAGYAVHAGDRSELFATPPRVAADADRARLRATAGDLVHTGVYGESVLGADLS